MKRRFFAILGLGMSQVGFGYSSKDFFTGGGSSATGIQVAERCQESAMSRPQTEKLLNWFFGCGHLPTGAKVGYTFEVDVYWFSLKWRRGKFYSMRLEAA
jgi:hypothetical protein